MAEKKDSVRKDIERSFIDHAVDNPAAVAGGAIGGALGWRARRPLQRMFSKAFGADKAAKAADAAWWSPAMKAFRERSEKRFKEWGGGVGDDGYRDMTKAQRARYDAARRADEADYDATAREFEKMAGRSSTRESLGRAAGALAAGGGGIAGGAGAAAEAMKYEVRRRKK